MGTAGGQQSQHPLAPDGTNERSSTSDLRDWSAVALTEAVLTSLATAGPDQSLPVSYRAVAEPGVETPGRTEMVLCGSESFPSRSGSLPVPRTERPQNAPGFDRWGVHGRNAIRSLARDQRLPNVDTHRSKRSHDCGLPVVALGPP